MTDIAKITAKVDALKHAYHQATFLQGQNTPCARHLFEAVDTHLRAVRDYLRKQNDG